MTWDLAFENWINSAPRIDNVRDAFRAAWQARGAVDANLFIGLVYASAQPQRQDTVTCPTDGFTQSTVKCFGDGTVYPISQHWSFTWIQPSWDTVYDQIHALDALDTSR